MQLRTTATATEDDKRFMKVAYEEARKGYEEGGIPIGAVLVSSTGEILGQGHNLRIQNSSPILHVPSPPNIYIYIYSIHPTPKTPTNHTTQAEISTLQSAGRLPASKYANTTMYTTLSPCSMCTGAILLYKISRVVIGENRTFMGSEDWLGVKGVEVVVLDDEGCRELMERFVRERPGDWGEDIGEEGGEGCGC
ncbi:cytosine deaminase [Orbilia javanica]|uniref:Cytosine deaminase n=1 Tax=Orbilia javanica TaxID=47235 RepID=A0AAN8RFG4_9PEZI